MIDNPIYHRMLLPAVIFIMVFYRGEAIGNISDRVNPHFTGKYCEECHERIPVKGGDAVLKFNGDFRQLCKCHDYDTETYIHPVNVEASDEKRASIPDDLPLEDGVLTCTTCHDMYKQCQYSSKFTPENKIERKYYKEYISFLRGSPYKSRTDICFRCHDKNRYIRFNPHEQLDASGKIIVNKCLYCHIRKVNEQTATFDDVELVGDLQRVCQRCHTKFAVHPAGVDHYVKPSVKVYERMVKLEAEYDMVFPLDSKGSIFCATCHNPHEKGVIPDERAGAKGASEGKKHRIPRTLCQSCHGM